MAKMNRRDVLGFGSASLALPLLAILDVGCTPNEDGETGRVDRSTDNALNENNNETAIGDVMKVQYLEIVTPDVDAVCKTDPELHGVAFSEPDANLGNARTAKLSNGGMLGVRAPLRDTEEPIVRPYFLVEDIEASVSKAAESGAEIALPPMELPGHGWCAIFFQGGAEHGLWQL
jgi:predicted enzyme related to lactoylglutathione lyase